MITTVHFRFISAGLITFMLLMSAAGMGQQPPIDKETNEAIRNTLRGIFIRDIDVEGVVVNENGEQLTDVKLRISLFKNGQHDFYELVRDRFQVKYDDCMGVYLAFFKDGYYYKEIRLSTNTEPTGTSEDNDPLISHKNMKIVLEEIGPATMLIEYNHDLEFLCQGESRGRLPYKDKQKKKLSPSGTQIRFDYTHGLDKLPQDCLYLRAECVEGRIRSIKTAYNSQLMIDIPEMLYLGIIGPGNGFILYQPSVVTQNKGSTDDAVNPEKDILRKLKTAPEQGYENEIKLDVHQENNFFYCKVGGYYGKGYLAGSPQVSHDCNKMFKIIRFWLQPDGSTNVRSPK